MRVSHVVALVQEKVSVYMAVGVTCGGDEQKSRH